MRLQHIAAALVLFASVAAAAPAALRAQEATPPSQAAPTNPPLPSPSPTVEDPKVHKLAVQQFLAWQSGTVNRDLYSDTVNADMTDEVMDKGTKTLANLGGLQQAQFRGISHAKGGVNFFVYKMQCQHGAIQMDFSLDRDGKIALIFFE
ncbi:MAG TPA: hypothetical protein VFE17_05995 [Candidatus Baltobacteraceae bacterium]|jgi:hypothetical protein|nr:hypothetical protein [Candidatus Baltobacteraceae bacterium]